MSPLLEALICLRYLPRLCSLPLILKLLLRLALGISASGLGMQSKIPNNVYLYPFKETGGTSMEHVTRYVRPEPRFTEREADDLLQWVEIQVLRIRASDIPLRAFQTRQLGYLIKLRTALQDVGSVGRLAVSTVTYEPDGNRTHLAVCNLHLEPVPCAYCTDTPEG